jgi:SPOR domain
MSYQQFGHIDPEERLDYVELPPEEGDEYPPPRRLPLMLLAAGVMAVFVGAVCFAYYEGTKHATVANAPASVATSGSPAAAPDTPANVPLIRADTDPVKVKPEKAGGMNIPDKDDPLYAMKPGQSPAEHILPPPETPQPRPVAPPPPAAAPQIAQATPQPGAFPAPLPAPPQVAALPKPAPKPADVEKPAVAAGPPMKIQLASLRTPDEARDEWQRVKHENSDLLGKFTAVAVRADLGDRGVWYRVEVGPVGDKTEALKLCKALKERDLGCQLVP